MHSIKLVADPRRDRRRVKAGECSTASAAGRLGFREQHPAGAEVPLDGQGSLHGCSVPALLLCLPARNGPGILQRAAVAGSFLGQHMCTVYCRAASSIPETAPGEWAWPPLVPHLPELCGDLGLLSE